MSAEQSSAATPAPAAAPVATDAAAVTTTKKQRRVVSSDTVAAAFADLQKLVEAQIETLRKAAADKADKAKGGSTGIKFLRTVNSRVKQLAKDAVRVMEASKKRPRATGKKSDGGFMKCHKVTADMAAFAGWGADELKSRIDITNAIVAYVKANNLQDEKARKNILPDEKLKSLLAYDPATPGNDPLTFFYLQKLIGKLQVKEPAAVKASA
jgi:upstream activation factor subunit UAF30